MNRQDAATQCSDLSAGFVKPPVVHIRNDDICPKPAMARAAFADPLAPPVMTATLPFSCMLEFPLLCRICLVDWSLAIHGTFLVRRHAYA